MKNVILDNNSYELVEKKSRFIADINYVTTEEEIKNKISETRKKHYSAKHVCFAYVLDTNPEILKYSDDGEPQGTAGKPMLDLLQVKNLTNILVTVTRYFGGILLGASGLVHAYKDSVNECIKKSTIHEVHNGMLINFYVNYDLIGVIKKYQETNKQKIFLQNEEYLDNIKMTYIIEKDFLQNFQNDLTNFSKGQININLKDETKFVKNDNKIIIL